MRKHLNLLLSLSTLTVLLIIPYFVFAQDSNPMLDRLNKVSGAGGYKTGTDGISLLALTGTIIQAAFGLLGAIFILIMVIAGYNWMMASGNEQRLEKAQTMIRRAIIGLIITLSSWAIWTFIFANLILTK